MPAPLAARRADRSTRRLLVGSGCAPFATSCPGATLAHRLPPTPPQVDELDRKASSSSPTTRTAPRCSSPNSTTKSPSPGRRCGLRRVRCDDVRPAPRRASSWQSRSSSTTSRWRRRCSTSAPSSAASSRRARRSSPPTPAAPATPVGASGRAPTARWSSEERAALADTTPVRGCMMYGVGAGDRAGQDSTIEKAGAAVYAPVALGATASSVASKSSAPKAEATRSRALDDAPPSVIAYRAPRLATTACCVLRAGSARRNPRACVWRRGGGSSTAGRRQRCWRRRRAKGRARARLRIPAKPPRSRRGRRRGSRG